MGVEELGRPLAEERTLSGEALVEHAAEGVDVRLGADLLAEHLLRCGVVQRADELPGGRERVRVRRRVLAEPEVGQVDVTAVADQDVRRLHVAVEQARVVHGVEGLGDLTEDGQGARSVERALEREQCLQIRSLDDLLGHEDMAVRPARRQYADDVRMLHRRCVLRLAEEAFDERLVLGQLGGEHLQRDGLGRP